MNYVKGLVVRSLAGHDKCGFFTVLSADDQFAVICDGKRRSLEKPKRKKKKHLAVTTTVLPDSSMKTNREIRNALRQFQTPQTDLHN
jgi:ribosomal protein L14E/L6E/L27E